MTCKPCQENALLSVGDAICHRMAQRGESVNCHALSGMVRQKRMSVHQYVEELEKRANAQEKQYVEELKNFF